MDELSAKHIKLQPNRTLDIALVFNDRLVVLETSCFSPSGYRVIKTLILPEVIALRAVHIFVLVAALNFILVLHSELLLLIGVVSFSVGPVGINNREDGVQRCQCYQ